MVKIYTSICFAVFLSVFGFQSLHANEALIKGINKNYFAFQQDTSKSKKDPSTYSVKTDTIGQMIRALQKFKAARDTVNIRSAAPVPNLSLQQVIKGKFGRGLRTGTKRRTGNRTEHYCTGHIGPAL